MPDQQNSAGKRKRQFGIINLLTWMIMAALVLVLLGNHRRESYANWQFESLPDDDRKLESWLVTDWGGKMVSVVRSENQVQITVEGKSPWRFRSNPLSEVPAPEWETLGYSGQRYLGGGYRSGFFLQKSWPNMLVPVVVAFALIFALNWFRQSSASADSDADATSD